MKLVCITAAAIIGAASATSNSSIARSYRNGTNSLTSSGILPVREHCHRTVQKSTHMSSAMPLPKLASVIVFYTPETMHMNRRLQHGGL